MHIKKLSFLISNLLVAGCFSFAITGTASAYTNGYWQGLSPAKTGQYTFRPLSPNRQPRHLQTQYRHDPGQRSVAHAQVRNVFSRFNLPAYAGMASAYVMPPRFVMPKLRSAPGSYNSMLNTTVYSPAQVLAENNRYYQMGRYAQPGRYSRPLQPAFARQYGWTPATKMVVRKGGGSDHYASEINAGFARQAIAPPVPEYRTEPVTQQGFRYRTINRNPGHVSFADKLRHLVPKHSSNSFRSDSKIALKSDNRQKPEAVVATASEPRPSAMPTVQRPVNNALVQVNTSGYRFRPDDRFESGKPGGGTETLPLTSQVNRVSAEDFQLANAKMESDNLDSSDQWFFRPSQPSSF